MARLRVSFCNFANAPKNIDDAVSQESWRLTWFLSLTPVRKHKFSENEFVKFFFLVETGGIKSALAPFLREITKILFSYRSQITYKPESIKSFVYSWFGAP